MTICFSNSSVFTKKFWRKLQYHCVVYWKHSSQRKGLWQSCFCSLQKAFIVITLFSKDKCETVLLNECLIILEIKSNEILKNQVSQLQLVHHYLWPLSPPLTFVTTFDLCHQLWLLSPTLTFVTTFDFYHHLWPSSPPLTLCHSLWPLSPPLTLCHLSGILCISLIISHHALYAHQPRPSEEQWCHRPDGTHTDTGS